MFKMLITLLVVVLLCASVAAFNVGRSVSRMQRSNLKMEYIPDGFTKQQWKALKDKEEADKKKNLGSLGVGKFKSRSFEAWQKSGGKHLFPVDPNNSKYEERPYMQRRGGDWEGGDLKERGLNGFGQGQAYQRLDLDDMYEKAQKAGMLNSVSIFGGGSLPWTNQATNEQNNSKQKVATPAGKKEKAQPALAAKKLSPQEMAALKSKLFKPIVTPKEVEKPKKKGLFGMF